MIDDILSNKKLNPIVTELFVRGRKLNIYLVFMALLYFAVPRCIRINFLHYFIIKIPCTLKHQKIALNHLLWIFTKIYCNTILFFSY